MSIPKVSLGKGGPKVGQLGFGCMGWTSFYSTNPVPEEQCIQTFIESAKQGITFFDTAILYGLGANERLLGKALRASGVPREQIFISDKFGIRVENGQMIVDGSPENTKKQCEQCLKDLGVDYIDLYSAHRIDPNVPIEKTIEAMVELKKEGKIRYLGLSEASAETIRRAHKVHPISAVQVEYSLWTRDIEDNGILATCRELGIAIVAYSPLGRGFLTGTFKSPQDFDDKDWRKNNPRLQGENFEKNKQLLSIIEEIANKRHVASSQIALAWVLNQGEDIIPIPGTRRLHYLQENIDSVKIKLTEEEKQKLNTIWTSAWNKI
jgi:aryl-alcohol dehydrogenase-like predicted oxidoreductase